MSDWKVVSSEEVYKSPWMTVHRDQVVNHSGTPLTYSHIAMRPAVFIVPVNAAGEICLIKNYRYPVNKSLWEVPAGFCEDENLLHAAQRELREETGLASADWTELTTLQQAAAIGQLPYTIFLAKGVHPVHAKRDKDEQITDLRFFSISDIEKMIKERKIIESAHIAAIYLAKVHLS